MPMHDPKPQDFKVLLAGLSGQPRATMLQARYDLGQAAAQYAKKFGLDVSELTITNLRLLKESKHLDHAEWCALDALRNEGNTVYHEWETANLTDAQSDEYARKVKKAIEDYLS